MSTRFIIYKKFSFLLTISVFIAASCKKADWYDKKPDISLAVPTTLSDFQSMMNNEYLNTFTPALGEFGTDGFVIIDPTYFNFMGTNFLNAYTWSHNFLYRNVADWNSNGLVGGYVRIFYSNVVLDGLKKNVPKNQAELLQWKNIYGQALYLRGRSFYEIAQVFAPPYNKESETTDIGIPIRLESNINLESKRLSIKETYGRIISDLLEAKDNLTDDLPSTILLKSKATKPAVYATLARVYLSMEEYSLASKYADSCLTLYNTLIDYNTLDTLSNRPFPQFNSEIIFYTITHDVFTPDVIKIDSNFYSQYGMNDLRRKIFFRTSGNNILFKGSYDTQGYLFTGLTTAEIYLIKAECYARAGDKEGAINQLKILLQKRWKTSAQPVNISAADASEALTMVLAERRKELFLRGLRWSDLRRLNKDDRFKIILQRVFAGNTYSLEPGSYKYTLPIPDDVIEITGMQQNSGW